MPSYLCPCGVTACSTATVDEFGAPIVPAPEPWDADGGLALCHSCGQRVALVA